MRSDPGGGGRAAPLIRSLASATAVMAVVSIVVFAAIPRVQGVQVVAPPFALAGQTPIEDFTGEVINPKLPSSRGDGVPAFSPDAYPGFGSSVDLRVRGRLSEEVVMKVRAAQPALWRAQAYDTWDGIRWTASMTDTTTAGANEVPIQVPPPAESPLGRVATKELVQTFYIERGQPNIVFAAAQPRELYFPATSVQIDPYGSIRAPILLDEGVVYSVVSDLPDVTPEELRLVRPVWDDHDLLARNTQLPGATPQRVIDLAHRITDGHATIYGKVRAVETWLQRNTEYRLDIPPDPPGADAVDHFLFERPQGTCEHISAAMVVLLRAVGIPARFAVGFDPGDRNLLTGYFEVRESDAHSWVEVHYPGIGWLPYDPTRVIPTAQGTTADTFAGAEVFGAIGRFLGGLIPEPVRDAAGALLRGVAGLAREAARAWPLTVLLAVVAASLVALGSRLRRRRRTAGGAPEGAAAAFAALVDAFAGRGVPRDPARTPHEYLRLLLARDPVARAGERDLRTIVTTFERDRFAPDEVDEAAVTEALAAAGRLRRMTTGARGAPTGSGFLPPGG